MQRYCHHCHAAYMRAYRHSHPLSPEQRRRDNTRSYAHVYLSRGKLTRQRCQECGDENSQMHHEDYGQPLVVTWLCRSCHLRLHRNVATASKAPDRRWTPQSPVGVAPAAPVAPQQPKAGCGGQHQRARIGRGNGQSQEL